MNPQTMDQADTDSEEENSKAPSSTKEIVEALAREQSSTVKMNLI